VVSVLNLHRQDLQEWSSPDSRSAASRVWYKLLGECGTALLAQYYTYGRMYWETVVQMVSAQYCTCGTLPARVRVPCCRARKMEMCALNCICIKWRCLFMDDWQSFAKKMACWQSPLHRMKAMHHIVDSICLPENECLAKLSPCGFYWQGS